VERVEKILPVRPAVEEIQNLFRDRVGCVHNRNIAPEYQGRREIVFEMHSVAPCHNQF
jgi:hypothetical protein